MTKETPALFDLESAYLDIDTIEAGRWLPLGAEFPGVEILARGLTSPDAKKLRAHLQRTANKDDRLSNGMLTAEADDRILRIVIARKCLMDWQGLGSGGKPVPFTAATAESLMTEPRARRIAAAIVNAIVDLENTTVAAGAAVTGN